MENITVNKEVQNEFYITKEQFLVMKATWAAKETHEAWHHIIYNVLRSKPIDLGFTIKKHHIQGDDEWYGFNDALRNASLYAKRYPNLIKENFGIDAPEDLLNKLVRIV